MNKAIATQDKLLAEGRRLIWSHGYSNVSLRQIAQAAGVDVALVSRYFGSKLGLFEATMETAFEFPDVASAPELVDIIVQIFMTVPRVGTQPSILQMIMMNAKDPEVGELVREVQSTRMQVNLTRVLGNAERAALFMAALLGFSMAEKSLHLDGIPPYGTPEYEAQLRHVLAAAVTYEP